MPINLNAPLAWENANVDEIALLDDLQGNILKGHGREHTQNLFFNVQKAKEGRVFLKGLAQSIKSARQQLIEAKAYRTSRQDAGIFISVLLSAAGYTALGITEDKTPKNPAFRSGLKQRQDLLSDPEIDDWDPAFQEQEQEKIHGMILIGGADETQVRQMRSKIQQQMSPSSKIIGTEYGLAMRNQNGDGIEHFGYVDGRSQPLMLKEDIDEETQNGGIDAWDPKFPLKQVLVPCRGGASETTSYGSYFVFRKLEQNVKGFKGLEEKIAEELTEIAKNSGLDEPNGELAGAMIVGRFEDGTPVIQKPDPQIENDGTKPPQPVPNNFNFDDDTGGKKCPFHAHIRKTNPRGESKALGATLEQERSHIMARRGITYGTRNAELNDQGKIIELKDKPVGGVGLLFMSYQSDLENQFEFTQQSWANNSDFVKQGTGIDPVIGQIAGTATQQQQPNTYELFISFIKSLTGQGSGAVTQQQQPVVWDSNKKVPIDFSGFVTMKGGEYFFAPCISFFKNL